MDDKKPLSEQVEAPPAKEMELCQDNVVNLDDQRPHACFDSGKKVVVLPLSTLEGVVNGKHSFTDLMDFEDIGVALLRDFVNQQKEGLT